MKFRTFLLGLSALFIASAAAYFSVSGLSKLFAGASTAVILMASSLEFGKLISASFLYGYWNDVNKILRTYLLIGVFILILITSAGIYGFLTSAYQTTADQLSVITKQTEVIELKKQRFQEQLDGYNKEKTALNQSISELSKGLSNNVFQIQGAEGQVLTTTSSANRKVLDRQLNDAKIQRDNVAKKIETLSDSVTKLDLKVIDVNVNNDLAAEVGPLKFMAEITGRPMATIVNWFALFIVFVFDPLAVTLVIAFNTAMRIDKQRESSAKSEPKEYRIYADKPKRAKKETEEADEEFSDLNILNTLNITENKKIPNIEPNIQTQVDKLSEPFVSASNFETDLELANLKRDFSRRGIDLDRDGSIDGIDTNGDGLIDEYTAHPNRSYDAKDMLPYYAKPGFDWNDKAKWINDQNAVNYWLANKKV